MDLWIRTLAHDLAGDVLIAIDGEALLDTFDLVYALKQKRTGSQVLLQIERQEVTFSVDVLFRQKDGTHPPLKQLPRPDGPTTAGWATRVLQPHIRHRNGRSYFRSVG